MKYKTKLLKKDVLTILCCVVFLLMSFGAIGNSGRRRAKEIVCLSNLRQWGHIFSIYTENNDSRFPSGTNFSGYWWVAQLEEQYKSYKKNPLWFCPTARRPLVDENGTTTPFLSTFTAWGIYSGDEYIFGQDGMAGSYAINGYVISIPPNFNFEGGIPASDGWRKPKIIGSENVPLFLDALRFDLWPLESHPPAANEFAAWSGNHMARCCINRHDGAVNSLFLDFSARKVGLKELWTLKWHRSFDTEGPWTTAGGATMWDWPEWMRNFKNY